MPGNRKVFRTENFSIMSILNTGIFYLPQHFSWKNVVCQSVFENCFLTDVPKEYDTSYPLGYASQFVL